MIHRLTEIYADDRLEAYIEANTADQHAERGQRRLVTAVDDEAFANGPWLSGRPASNPIGEPRTRCEGFE